MEIHSDPVLFFDVDFAGCACKFDAQIALEMESELERSNFSASIGGLVQMENDAKN